MSPGEGPAFRYASAELDSLAEARNYYGWITRHFAPHLGQRILEVGAGIGTFSGHLRLAAPDARMVLIEPAANNLPALRERFAADARVEVRGGYLDGGIEVGIAESVVAVNVMEHVRDDAAFLAAAHRALVPGGRLLLFVPALPALYGTLDEAFEHFRRYTRPELRDKVAGAGFRIDRLRYVNLPGIAAWWLSGKVLRKRTVTPADARLYDRWVIPWLSRLEDRIAPPLGQSLLVVASRPPSA